MRYRLRTLLILLAVGPPTLAGAWFWGKDLYERQQLQDWEEPGITSLVEDLEDFRAPFSGLVELYDPQTGRTNWYDPLISDEQTIP